MNSCHICTEKMEDERISTLMKYVRGEISFAEWIESGAGAADTEQIEDENEIQDGVGDDEGDLAARQTTETLTTVNEESNALTGELNTFPSIKGCISCFMNLKLYIVIKAKVQILIAVEPRRK